MSDTPYLSNPIFIQLCTVLYFCTHTQTMICKRLTKYGILGLSNRASLYKSTTWSQLTTLKFIVTIWSQGFFVFVCVCCSRLWFYTVYHHRGNFLYSHSKTIHYASSCKSNSLRTENQCPTFKHIAKRSGTGSPPKNIFRKTKSLTIIDNDTTCFAMVASRTKIFQPFLQ